ncbi:MAG: hypothetical protein ACTSRP_26980 [Candidatus Helarchaeota archaeon]
MEIEIIHYVKGFPCIVNDLVIYPELLKGSMIKTNSGQIIGEVESATKNEIKIIYGRSGAKVFIKTDILLGVKYIEKIEIENMDVLEDVDLDGPMKFLVERMRRTLHLPGDAYSEKYMEYFDKKEKDYKKRLENRGRVFRGIYLDE